MNVKAIETKIYVEINEWTFDEVVKCQKIKIIKKEDVDYLVIIDENQEEVLNQEHIVNIKEGIIQIGKEYYIQEIENRGKNGIFLTCE